MARFVLFLAASAIATAAPISPAQLVQEIKAAAQAGAPLYTVPPGVYNFSAAPGVELTLVNAIDFHLAAEGALFLFSLGGITLQNCTRVTVSGATIDASPVPFTQSKGPITDVVYYPGPVNHSADVSFTMEIDDGYPSIAHLLPRGTMKAYFWDASTRLLFHEQVDTSPVFTNATPAAGQPGAWRVYAHLPYTLAGWRPPAAGALASLSPSNGAAVLVINSSGTAVDNVTLHASSGMGYLEAAGGGGTRISRWRAVRPPPSLPPAARLLVSNLDGVHSTSVVAGLTLEDSEVSFAGDDAFAVHCELGVAWGEYDAGGDGIWVIDTGGASSRTVATAQPGEPLLFFALTETMDPLGAGTVAAVAVEPNATLQAAAARAAEDIARELGIAMRPLDAVALLLRVRFTAPLPPVPRVRFGALVQYNGRCGSGTTVRRSILRDSSGGARLKGLNVAVTDSYVANVYGLRMLPEVFWTQSVSFNVSITGNVLNGTGGTPEAPDSIAYANATCSGLVLRNNTVLPWAPPTTAAGQ